MPSSKYFCWERSFSMADKCLRTFLWYGHEPLWMTKRDRSMESFEMGMASHWKMILGLICPHSDARVDEAMGHWDSKTRYMGSKSSVGHRDIQIWKSTLGRESRGISAGRSEQRAGREKACKQTVQTIIFARIFGRPVLSSSSGKAWIQSSIHKAFLITVSWFQITPR